MAGDFSGFEGLEEDRKDGKMCARWKGNERTASELMSSDNSNQAKATKRRIARRSGKDANGGAAEMRLKHILYVSGDRQSVCCLSPIAIAKGTPLGSSRARFQQIFKGVDSNFLAGDHKLS